MIFYSYIILVTDCRLQVGGKLDTSTDRIKITDRYMQIKDLTKEDHGTYECRAINPIATVVSLTDLRIDSEFHINDTLWHIDKSHYKHT